MRIANPACLFVRHRGVLEGVAGDRRAHFYNSIDNFQQPSGRFSIYTAVSTAHLSFLFDLSSFFAARGGVILKTFPPAERLLLLLRPFARVVTMKYSKSRWQIVDRLVFIESVWLYRRTVLRVANTVWLEIYYSSLADPTENVVFKIHCCNYLYVLYLWQLLFDIDRNRTCADDYESDLSHVFFVSRYLIFYIYMYKKYFVSTITKYLIEHLLL